MHLSGTDELAGGQVRRTPLPQQGGAVGVISIPQGVHVVTGGTVRVGSVANGAVKRIVGIDVNDPLLQLQYGYRHGTTGLNQPFARNLACLMFEMRAAGISRLTNTSVNNQQIIDYLREARRVHDPNAAGGPY